MSCVKRLSIHRNIRFNIVNHCHIWLACLPGRQVGDVVCGLASLVLVRVRPPGHGGGDHAGNTRMMSATLYNGCLLSTSALSAKIHKTVNKHQVSQYLGLNPNVTAAPVPCLRARDVSPAMLHCPGPLAWVAQVFGNLGGGARAVPIRVDLRQ